jgi:hypothetical protein
MAGAPEGNRNAAKGRRWTDAINKALARYTNDELAIGAGEALDYLASRIVQSAVMGDKDSIWEVANRLEGKPAQAVTLSGDEDNPLQHNHTVTFIGDR